MVNLLRNFPSFRFGFALAFLFAFSTNSQVRTHVILFVFVTSTRLLHSVLETKTDFAVPKAVCGGEHLFALDRLPGSVSTDSVRASMGVVVTEFLLVTIRIDTYHVHITLLMACCCFSERCCSFSRCSRAAFSDSNT